jgi:hypothetical protein
MKAARYVLVAAGIVAVLAMIAWLLRDNLIQRISNPLLDDYGISVTDVSLDALASSDATIGYLELVHDKGTTIAIEDLTLPLGTTSAETKTYTAGKVTIITTTRTDGESFELAELIKQFISLPDNLDDSDVAVAEFSLPPYPTVYDLSWGLADGEQKFRGTVDSVAMSATITRSDATDHAIVFSLPGKSAPVPGHFVTANLHQGDQGILINGMSSIDLPTWEPMARLSGVIPPEIEIASGTATLQFDVEIPNDTTLSPTVSASLAPNSLLQLTYTGTSDDITSVLVDSASPAELAATFPEVDWSLQQAQASLRVTYGDWQDIPLSIDSLSCESGPACSMDTRITMETAELPIGSADLVEFVFAGNVLFPGTGVRVDVLSGATLSMTGLATAETKVDRIEAQLVSTASLDLVDAGWRLAADSLDVKIGAVSVADDMSVSMPIFLENILISELDEKPVLKSGIYAPSSRATLNEQSITLPGFKGEISLQNADVTIDLKTVGLYQNGTVMAKHNLDSRAGQLSVVDTAVSFETTSLSNRISPWPDDRNLIAGTVSLGLDANWTQKNSSLDLDAKTSMAFAELAGYYADTAFAGLSTQVNVAYRSAPGFVAEPSTIRVALIEAGLPVKNLSASYTLDPNAMSIDVENLQMTAFGGVIRADPFSFRTDRDRNTLTLRAESIELTELLSLNEFETIEVSGSIGAMLPVTIEGDIVTIEDGTLTGDPAGGVIRYKPDTAPDEADASTIGLVTRALSNFEFDTLTSDVDLTREGDLNLKLQLTGRNPDLEEKRPVVLNLGVENNIPQMLKSLRAARAVEEILEKRLSE